MDTKKGDSFAQFRYWVLNLHEVLGPITARVLHFWGQMFVNMINTDITTARAIASQAANILFQNVLHDFHTSHEEKQMDFVFIDPKWIGVLSLGVEEKISER